MRTGRDDAFEEGRFGSYAWVDHLTPEELERERERDRRFREAEAAVAILDFLAAPLRCRDCGVLAELGEEHRSYCADIRRVRAEAAERRARSEAWVAAERAKAVARYRPACPECDGVAGEHADWCRS